MDTVISAPMVISPGNGDAEIYTPDSSQKNFYKCTKCGRPYLSTEGRNHGLCKECEQQEGIEIPFSYVVELNG